MLQCRYVAALLCLIRYSILASSEHPATIWSMVSWNWSQILLLIKPCHLMIYSFPFYSFWVLFVHWLSSESHNCFNWCWTWPFAFWLTFLAQTVATSFPISSFSGRLGSLLNIVARLTTDAKWCPAGAAASGTKGDLGNTTPIQPKIVRL